MLSGSITVLRSPAEKDRDLLIAVRNDVSVQMALMTQPRANTHQRVNEWLARVMSDPQNIFFLIARANDDAAVGFIQVTRMDFLHGTGQLGIYVTQTAQGRGYATEALSLLEKYVKDVFNLRKIILEVLASNERAIAFYKKSDYAYVGTHKLHFYQLGHFHDVVIMEKLLLTEHESTTST